MGSLKGIVLGERRLPSVELIPTATSFPTLTLPTLLLLPPFSSLLFLLFPVFPYLIAFLGFHILRREFINLIDLRPWLSFTLPFFLLLLLSPFLLSFSFSSL